MIDPIRAEAIRTLYQQASRSLGAALVITVYTVSTAWAFTPWATIAAWAVCVLAIQVARALLIRAFNRKHPQGAELERWAGYYTLHQFVTGVVWGGSFILFAHLDQPITIALTLACLYSIAAGSVPAQAYNPPTLFALVVPVYAQIVAKLILSGDFAYIMIGIACALYAVTMMAFCRVQARAVAESLRIRFENAELVQALTVEKAEAENARREAERASLAKSQFLAAASHDLRQPLYALSLFSASLGTLKLDAEGRVVLANIQDSIAAMESLFVGLLDVSRLDAGVVRPQFTSVSVDALFDRLSQYFRPIALERNLDLRFRSDDEWVSSDATLLEQVLSNLVSNALRCTKEGAVLVAARKRGDAVRIEVWDTGVGIAEADRVRIFEEFVQLENPERDRRKGMGLGLSIAQRSAALLESGIAVWSRQGRGSRFTISQPMVSPPKVEARAEAVRRFAAPAIRSDLPVLVVDDDRDVRVALGDLLKRWGVSFEIVVDAAEALRRIDDGGRYGLVLADYRLPGAMNGLDLVSAIAERRLVPQPTCALITGDFDPKIIAAAQGASLPLYHKPLRPSQLRAILSLPAEVAA